MVWSYLAHDILQININASLTLSLFPVNLKINEDKKNMKALELVLSLKYVTQWIGFY